MREVDDSVFIEVEGKVRKIDLFFFFFFYKIIKPCLIIKSFFVGNHFFYSCDIKIWFNYSSVRSC